MRTNLLVKMKVCSCHSLTVELHWARQGRYDAVLVRSNLTRRVFPTRLYYLVVTNWLLYGNPILIV